MNIIRIVCKGTVEHSAELDAYIKQQLEKVTGFLDHEHGPATLDLVISGHPSHAHNEVHLHIIGPRFEVVASREGHKLNAVIDEVVDIAYHELHRIKEKHVDEKKNPHGPHRPD